MAIKTYKMTFEYFLRFFPISLKNQGLNMVKIIKLNSSIQIYS